MKNIFTMARESAIFTKISDILASIRESAFGKKISGFFSSLLEKTGGGGAVGKQVNKTIGGMLSGGIFKGLSKVAKIQDLEKFAKAESKVAKILNFLIRGACIIATGIFAVIVIYFFFKSFFTIVGYAAMAVAMTLGYKFLMSILDTATGKHTKEEVVVQDSATA